MSSFNVAQILPSLDSGGVERGTIEVANYLSELNLKNNIISNGGRLIKEIDKNYTDHFQLPVNSKNFFIYPLIANQLKKLIFNQNINVVHVRSRAPAWILSFIKNRNFKTISTFHNVYSGNSYFKKIYNKQLSKVDQIVAISNYVKNEISKKYNLDSNKIKVINRGVDVKYFEKPILDSKIENIKDNNLLKFQYKFLEVNIYWNNFDKILLKSRCCISMAGTAAEQAIGLGKPVIQIEGKGPQFTKSFAEAQRRLLGHYVFCATNFKNKNDQINQTINLIVKVIYLIKLNKKFLILCNENAKKRLGENKACLKMVDDMNIVIKNDYGE